GRHEFKGGITLKYLQGIAAAYFRNTNLTYNIVDTAQFIFTHSSIDYGRTDYNSLINNNSKDLIHGHGFGINIGFTYVHLRDSHENDKEIAVANENYYKYKIGLSIIDLGSINYNKNTAAFYLE